MAKDMTKLLASSVDEDEHTEFLNTGMCLALILQSSSPFLDINALGVIPRVVELQLDALVKYTRHTPTNDALEIGKDLCLQARVLVTVVIAKTATLREGAQPETSKVVQMQQWKQGMVESILKIMCKALCDVANQPSELIPILHMHIMLAAVMKQHSYFSEAEDALCKAYGDHGVCFQLR